MPGLGGETYPTEEILDSDRSNRSECRLHAELAQTGRCFPVKNVRQLLVRSRFRLFHSRSPGRLTQPPEHPSLRSRAGCALENDSPQHRSQWKTKPESRQALRHTRLLNEIGLNPDS